MVLSMCKWVLMLTYDMRRDGTFNQEVMGSNTIALTNNISMLAKTQKSRQFTADL
jgi:hypothetical protein